jgi:hypothetical protein
MDLEQASLFPETQAIIAQARELCAKCASLRTGLQEEIQRSQELRARHCALQEWGAATPEQTITPPGKRPKEPKHNKLVYKKRWLISQNIVISLRRACVICDIIAPDELLADAAPPSAQHEPDEMGGDTQLGEMSRRVGKPH